MNGIGSTGLGAISRGTAWLSFSTLALKGIGLATIFLVLTYLTPYEYGVVELTLAVLPLFSIFLLPGLQPIVVADMSIASSRGEFGTVRGLYLAYGRAYGMLAVLAWAILFFGSGLIATYYSEQISLYLKIVSFGLLLSPVRSLCTMFFTYALRFKEQSLVGFLEEMFKLLLVFLLVVYASMGITGMLLATVLAQAGALLILAPWCAHLYGKTLRAYRPTSVSTLSLLRGHAAWGIVSTYVGSFSQSARLYIIKAFLGTEAVALFAVSLGLVSHILALVPLSAVVGPMLAHARADVRRLALLLSKGVKYQALMYAVAAVAAFFALPYFISFFFPQYVATLPLMRVLLLLLLPSAVDTFFPYIFSAFQAQRSQFFAALYKMALTVILTPLAIAALGFLGIGYALVLINVLYDIERYRNIRTFLPEFRMRIKDLFRVDEIDGTILRHMRDAVLKRGARMLR